MAKHFTLGRNERLKSRKAIEQLFREGLRFSLTGFSVHYILTVSTPKSGNSSLQCGVGVSTRNFKKAVDRNRIKRLIREAYRLQKNDLQETLEEKKRRLDLFLVYTAKELPDYKLVSAKVNVILNKLQKLVNENNPPNS